MLLSKSCKTFHNFTGLDYAPFSMGFIEQVAEYGSETECDTGDPANHMFSVSIFLKINGQLCMRVVC